MNTMNHQVPAESRANLRDACVEQSISPPVPQDHPVFGCFARGISDFENCLQTAVRLISELHSVQAKLAGIVVAFVSDDNREALVLSVACLTQLRRLKGALHVLEISGGDGVAEACINRVKEEAASQPLEAPQVPQDDARRDTHDRFR